MAAARVPVEQRFWQKVDKDGPTMPGMSSQCWVWTGCAPEVSTGFRYGQIRVDGKVGYTHRVAYQLQTGQDPGDHDVDHICHNTLCVRGIHLRLATRSQNNQNRRGARRDSQSGVRGVHWNAKLGKWVAHIGHGGQLRHIGVYDSLEAADVAATAKRCELFTHNDWDRLPTPLGARGIR
jgi:hypothetical protein